MADKKKYEVIFGRGMSIGGKHRPMGYVGLMASHVVDRLGLVENGYVKETQKKLTEEPQEEAE